MKRNGDELLVRRKTKIPLKIEIKWNNIFTVITNSLIKRFLKNYKMKLIPCILIFIHKNISAFGTRSQSFVVKPVYILVLKAPFALQGKRNSYYKRDYNLKAVKS